MIKTLTARCLSALLAFAIAAPAQAQKISADPTASALAGGEYLAGVQSAANVKILPSQILTYARANLYSVNLQTGTSYTYVTGDRGKLVSHSNAAAIAGTLPQATSTFGAGWFMLVQNRGAGTLTITPTTSTIDGASTLVLTTGNGAFILSDGTNWYTAKSSGGGGGTPAGSSTWVQYNSSGAFGAEAAFTYDPATDLLSVVNITQTGLHITAAPTTSAAGLRLPHGTAPTSPVNGDLWTTSAGGLYARINGTTVGPFGTGSGGVTGFTSSLATTSPNNTVNASVLAASGGTTDQDAVLSAKGAGALQALLADGTGTGGNKRGANAVDWQVPHLADATNVASGANSVLSGGTGNKADGSTSVVGGGGGNRSAGSWATVGGGASNSAGTNYSTIAGGNTNTISTNTGAAIGGGDNNTASGTGATIPGGSGHLASGAYSVTIGKEASTRGLQGAFAQSASKYSSAGDRQTVRYVQRMSTTNATTVATSADGATAAAATAIVLPDNSGYAFRARVIARNNANGDTAGFEIAGVIKRGANAAATALVGTPTVTALGASAGASAWTAVAAADTTLGSLAINVTGAASTTIGWAVMVETVEAVQ